MRYSIDCAIFVIFLGVLILQSEIAKQMHFEFSTPKKNTVAAVRSPFHNENGCDEIEAPNAPLMLKKSKSRLSTSKLADISVTLFP